MSSPEKVSLESYKILDDFWWVGIRYLTISIKFRGCQPCIVTIPIDCDRAS